jgi:hypothetical protein
MELIEKIILALPSIIIAGIVAYIAYHWTLDKIEAKKERD